MKQIVELAPLVKVSDTHDQAMAKLQPSINKTDTDLSVTHEALIQTGANYKPGKGPVVHMERILHTKLDTTQLCAMEPRYSAEYR
eukprot:5440030-Pyramimonas_sp.AAC.1